MKTRNLIFLIFILLSVAIIAQNGDKKNIAVTVYVFISARANAAFDQHRGTLLCRLQQNEAHRCFMADMIPKEILNDKATQLVVKERLQLLQDVSACIGIIMKNMAASDPNLSIRVLGGVASVSIFSLHFKL